MKGAEIVTILQNLRIKVREPDPTIQQSQRTREQLTEATLRQAYRAALAWQGRLPRA